MTQRRNPPKFGHQMICLDNTRIDLDILALRRMQLISCSQKLHGASYSANLGKCVSNVPAMMKVLLGPATTLFWRFRCSSFRWPRSAWPLSRFAQFSCWSSLSVSRGCEQSKPSDTEIEFDVGHVCCHDVRYKL